MMRSRSPGLSMAKVSNAKSRASAVTCQKSACRPCSARSQVYCSCLSRHNAVSLSLASPSTSRPAFPENALAGVCVYGHFGIASMNGARVSSGEYRGHRDQCQQSQGTDNRVGDEPAVECVAVLCVQASIFLHDLAA